jgi:hypothetical protein
MIFENVEIDVLSQESIIDAKAKMPGKGVGPAVSRELTKMVREGDVITTSQLPREYTFLSHIFNLPA